MRYKQRGRNEKYPLVIEAWRIGEKVPEWLSDRAKVNFIDGLGNITLDRRDHPEGGYEIIEASGIQPLVYIKERSGYVCFGDNKIFGLTEIQMEILYEEESN